MSIQAMSNALGVLESIGLRTQRMNDSISELRQAIESAKGSPDTLNDMTLRQLAYTERSPGHTFEQLEDLVIHWAYQRGIYENSGATKQFLKAVSEMGEVADGLAKMNMAEIKDGVGDTLVCLINFCEMLGTSPTECLEIAYDEIKGRKGEMVNGVFMKEVAK